MRERKRERPTAGWCVVKYGTRHAGVLINATTVNIGPRNVWTVSERSLCPPTLHVINTIHRTYVLTNVVDVNNGASASQCVAKISEMNI